ncbi:hypothetical protein ZOD2009_09905 [Haladaptatus paucihalophilus DX253]|uniref:Uncharacterized protein n=1 Tax=Haladaptatus paucihalophilus DX253 TaxID=797209 RepID=E7QSX3_HALPU|nr:hypothetical protein ZOD2009_09905 [Haladaptatus paucihalophilus DX253]SHL61633.1 hypothetical protein SAMN05444342_4263 [Haladaptatus paucihalophilus DX253]
MEEFVDELEGFSGALFAHWFSWHCASDSGEALQELVSMLRLLWDILIGLLLGHDTPEVAGAPANE